MAEKVRRTRRPVSRHAEGSQLVASDKVSIIRLAIVPTAVSIVAALVVSGIVSYFSQYLTVAILNERVSSLEEARQEIKFGQPSAVALENLFTRHTEEITELKSAKADALVLQNYMNMQQSDIRTLQIKIDTLCQTTAKLEALTDTAKSLPRDLSAIAERVAMLEARFARVAETE